MNESKENELSISKTLLNRNLELKNKNCRMSKRKQTCKNMPIGNKNLKNLQVEIVVDNQSGVTLNMLHSIQGLEKNLLKVLISWGEIENLQEKFNLDAKSGADQGSARASGSSKTL